MNTTNDGDYMRKRVGIIGYGTIGSYLVKRIKEDNDIEIVFVYEKDEFKSAQLSNLKLDDFSRFTNYRPDIVVECALNSVVWEFAPTVLQYCDMMIMSNTALADDSFRNSIVSLCRNHKTKLFAVHGGILGLDGIYDGRNIIKRVTISSDKHPNNFDRDDTEKTVIFEGPTKEICSLYPRNVNTHAAVAMASIGFENTISKMIANPNTDVNSHSIEVDAEGIAFRIEIKSPRASKITGVYTLESAYQSLRRLCVDNYGINIV